MIVDRAPNSTSALEEREPPKGPAHRVRIVVDEEASWGTTRVVELDARSAKVWIVAPGPVPPRRLHAGATDFLPTEVPRVRRPTLVDAARVTSAATQAVQDVARRAAAGDRRGAIDRVYQYLGDQLSADQRLAVEVFCSTAMQEDLPLAVHFSILTATRPSRDIIASRPLLVDHVRRLAIEAKGEEQARRAMKGID